MHQGMARALDCLRLINDTASSVLMCITLYQIVEKAW